MSRNPERVIIACTLQHDIVPHKRRCNKCLKRNLILHLWIMFYAMCPLHIVSYVFHYSPTDSNLKAVGLFEWVDLSFNSTLDGHRVIGSRIQTTFKHTGCHHCRVHQDLVPTTCHFVVFRWPSVRVEDEDAIIVKKDEFHTTGFSLILEKDIIHGCSEF